MVGAGAVGAGAVGAGLVPARTPSPDRTRMPQQPVLTEIGDLPADLWELLGRKGPEADRRPQAHTAPEKPAQPAASGRMMEAPPVVQRAVAEEPAEETGEESAEPNIDALARKVYLQLRRRLHVEAERIDLRPGRS